MYEIAICDDDSAFALKLSSMLEDLLRQREESFHVTLFSDPSLMLAALEQGAEFSLLFQDILFGEEKGIQFARLLWEQKRDIDVVFVTTSVEYAVEGYDAHPLHYLIKPVSTEKLAEVLDYFLRRHTPQTLCLATPHETLCLTVSDILYFETYNHIVTVHLRNGQCRSLRYSLQQLENDLPPDRFVHTQRSYLVNMEHIYELNRRQVRLSSGETVPISRRSYAGVQMGLAAYSALDSIHSGAGRR